MTSLIPAPTVVEAWTAFINYYELRAAVDEISPNTVDNYRRLRATLGELTDIRIDALTKPAVFAWHRSFAQILSIRTGKPRRAQGNNARHVLGLVCEYAELMGWRRENTNPVRGVPRFTIRPRERFLSVEECVALNRCLALVELRRSCRRFQHPLSRVAVYSPTRIIRGLYLSGRRFGELADLQDQDLDLVSARPTMICNVKGKGRRAYPLAPPMVALLQEQVHRCQGITPYVFPSPTSESGHIESVTPVWLEVCELAGIQMVLHGLRHTGASQLLLHGVDRRDVERFLDDDRATLSTHYDHIQITPTHRRAVDIGTDIMWRLGAGLPVDDGYRPLRQEALQWDSA